MDAHTNLGKMWRHINKVAGQRLPTEPTHPNPAERAQELLQSFKDRGSSEQLSEASQRRLRDALPDQEGRIREACLRVAPTDIPFTDNEMTKALQSKPDTAAGADRVTYSMIRHSGPAGLSALLDLVNASFEAGRLPSAWKEAIILPIPKPREPGKTRPISLLSCLGKTAEKMVLRRLQWTTGPLNPNIYAYRSGTGTRDCLLDILTTLSNRKAAVVFLDLEKAFELANANAILSALVEKGVEGRLLRWIKDFLYMRKARVRFQGHLSASETFENGTPQGSTLSPFLFNILMEKLVTTELPAGCKVLSYADDIAVVSTGVNCLRKLQRALATVAGTCTDLGLKINMQKTKAMHFKTNQSPAPLRINADFIPWVPAQQYLGVWLDKRLSFTIHVGALKERMRTRLNVMRRMTSIDGGAGYRVLRTFYLQAIRSLIDYAAPVLATLSPAQMTVLERVQNEALRLTLGAPRWTKICNLRAETGVPPIQLRIHALNSALLWKAVGQASNAPLLRNIQQALCQDPDLFRSNTLARKVAPGIRSLQAEKLFLHHKRDQPHPDFRIWPPWEPSPLTIRISRLSGKKDTLERDDLYRQAERAVLDGEVQDTEVYYTDGSVDPDTGRAASAFVHPALTQHHRLPDGSSTLQTELAAIAQALDHALSTRRSVTIHTDSMGALMTLQNAEVRSNVGLVTSILVKAKTLQERGLHVTLNWVPSHTGIKGNDAADNTAKTALLLPQVTLHIPASMTQVKGQLHKAATKMARVEVTRKAVQGSPSATWYSVATKNSPQITLDLPRRIRTRLHRLRLGYHCKDDIFERLPHTCTHCGAESDTPLLHYIMECPETGPFFRREADTAPRILQNTDMETLTALVHRFPPPR